MDFAFTEDQTMLRDTVREVLTRECGAEVVRKAWETGSGRAQSVWATLADTGVVGMTASEHSGGLGMNEVDLALVLEECGYAGLPEPIVETVAVAIPMLEEFGSDALKAQWLTALTSGERTVALGLREGLPVPHAPVADLLLLQCAGAVFAVPRDQVGIIEEVSVDRARRLATVDFKPDAQWMLADGDSAQRAIGQAFERAAWATSAVLVGITRRMLDMSVQYAKDREQFGRPIGAQQAIKHRLANALIAQEFARPQVYRAAWALAHHSPDRQLAVSMAKIYAGAAAKFVAQQALQVHGAIGYTIECDLHMWMKRAWALSAVYGDDAFHRDRIGLAVLPSGN